MECRPRRKLQPAQAEPAPGPPRAACAISPARHSGHKHGRAGSSLSACNDGISRHQHSNGCACLPQSNAVPQRGQRGLLVEREADGFMTGWDVRRGIDEEMMPRLASPRESSIRLIHGRHASALSLIAERSLRPAVAQCAKPTPPAARAAIENPVAARQSCTIRPVLTVPCLSLPPCPSFPTFRRSRPP
jgi:hypothetical protein